MELQGKTAVVTGAGSGIGRGLATGLAGQGMNVVLVGRHQAPLDETAALVAGAGGQSVTVTADVSQLGDVERVADEATSAFDAVHLLCNNAGIGPFGTAAETTIEEWKWILDVNLWSVIHGIHVFLPRFEAQGEGHICSTASEGGLYSPPFLAAYNTSKFAVVGLMQSVARELQALGSNVTASVYCPGAVHSNILQTSENRPASAKRSAELSPATEAFRGIVTEVVSTGMDPAAAAACVIDGIQRDQFWIFSHDHVPKVALRQAEEMASTRTLSDL